MLRFVLACVVRGVLQISLATQPLAWKEAAPKSATCSGHRATPTTQGLMQLTPVTWELSEQDKVCVCVWVCARVCACGFATGAAE